MFLPQDSLSGVYEKLPQLTNAGFRKIPAILNNAMKRLIGFSLRLRNPRLYWERRAALLRTMPQTGWFVGRVDMRSYVQTSLAFEYTSYVHYAYPPDESDLDTERIPFLGSPVSALRRAVKYAEKRNKCTAFHENLRKQCEPFKGDLIPNLSL